MPLEPSVPAAARFWFIETLTVPAWHLDVLPRLLAASPRPERIYALDSTRPGLALARAAAAALGVAVEPLRFRMLEVRDDDGLMLRLRLAHQDLAELQREVVGEPEFQRWLENAGRPGRLPSYLKKAVVVMSLNDRTLWRALYVLQVAAWKLRALGERGSLMFLEERPWFSTLARYGARTGLQVLPARPAVRTRALAQQLLPSSWITLGRLVRREGASGARKFWARAGAAAAPGGPKLAAEHYGHLNLDRPEMQSDVFFWQQSRIPAEDLLIIFGVPRDPLDERTHRELKARGIDSVALYPLAARGEVPLFLPSGKAPPPAPPAKGPNGRWLRRNTEEYHRRRAFWRELFASRGVKAYVSWYKSDPVHCAAADALRDVGGVLALYQRSYEGLPTVELSAHADVHFSYSRDSAGILGRDGSEVRYNVVTGFLGDHRFPLLRPQADALRARLHAAGATRIVAAYDENSLDDPRWHTGHDLQRSNYRLLCEKVLAEPWLGVVFKPKAPATLRRRLGPVAELLAAAEATGRCHLYADGAVFGSASPAAAALAADVVIHGHLCGGTAALEAALTGKPTLLVDQEGWSVSPLYRLGPGRVVFKCWEDVWAALMTHWSAPKGIPGLGDWSEMLPEMDPFRDGGAAKRMGQFLQTLMDGFKEGLDRERALERAADDYAQRWGADKVMERRSSPQA